MDNPLGKIADKLADVFANEGERTRAALASGLTKTVNGLRVTGARPQALQANAIASTGAGRLVGWSIRETAGAAAVITIYAARDASDPLALVATIPLVANGGDTKLPAVPGVSFGDGLYVAVTGAVAGALYFGAVDRA